VWVGRVIYKLRSKERGRGMLEERRSWEKLDLQKTQVVVKGGEHTK